MSEQDHKEGLAAAVARMEVGAPPREAGEQDDMFDQARAATPMSDADHRIRRASSGPGRPKGARNRRTEEWTAYILAHYRSPLVVLAELYSRPVGELAAELQCEKLEALKIQANAAAALAPYIHQKQPQALEVSEKKVGVLVLGSFQGDASGATGLPLADDSGDGERQQNQQVIDAQAAQSDGAKSDG